MSHSTLDLAIFHAINGMAGNDWRDLVVRHVASDMFLRVAILAIPYVYFWFSPSHKSNRPQLVSALLAPILAIVIARLVSIAFPFELRPMYDVTSGYRAVESAGVDLENYSSFPSDTAAYTMAFTLGLLSVNRAAAFALTGISMIIFSVSRIYLGVHYPQDIAVGWLIGILCAGFARLPQVLIVGRKVVAWGEKREAVFYSVAALGLYEMGEVFYNLRHFLHLLRLLA